MVESIEKAMNRRGVVLAVALCVVSAYLGSRAIGAEGDEPAGPGSANVFRLWTMGCAHVGTDLRVGKRESPCPFQRRCFRTAPHEH